MTVRRVRAHDRFPSGDSQALLEGPSDPARPTARDAPTFKDGIDNLDRYLPAVIALPDGWQAWLVKYRGERDAGTTVYAVDLGIAKAAMLRILPSTEESSVATTRSPPSRSHDRDRMLG
jgi:hypothetical protein